MCKIIAYFCVVVGLFAVNFVFWSWDESMALGSMMQRRKKYAQ